MLGPKYWAILGGIIAIPAIVTPAVLLTRHKNSDKSEVLEDLIPQSPVGATVNDLKTDLAVIAPFKVTDPKMKDKKPSDISVTEATAIVEQMPAWHGIHPKVTIVEANDALGTTKLLARAKIAVTTAEGNILLIEKTIVLKGFKTVRDENATQAWLDRFVKKENFLFTYDKKRDSSGTATVDYWGWYSLAPNDSIIQQLKAEELKLVAEYATKDSHKATVTEDITGSYNESGKRTARDIMTAFGVAGHTEAKNSSAHINTTDGNISWYDHVSRITDNTIPFDLAPIKFHLESTNPANTVDTTKVVTLDWSPIDIDLTPHYSIEYFFHDLIKKENATFDPYSTSFIQLYLDEAFYKTPTNFEAKKKYYFTISQAGLKYLQLAHLKPQWRYADTATYGSQWHEFPSTLPTNANGATTDNITTLPMIYNADTTVTKSESIQLSVYRPSADEHATGGDPIQIDPDLEALASEGPDLYPIDRRDPSVDRRAMVTIRQNDRNNIHEDDIIMIMDRNKP